MVVRRFLRSGMTMEEVSNRMDVSMGDLKKLLERTPAATPERSGRNEKPLTNRCLGLTMAVRE